MTAYIIRRVALTMPTLVLHPRLRGGIGRYSTKGLDRSRRKIQAADTEA